MDKMNTATHCILSLLSANIIIQLMLFVSQASAHSSNLQSQRLHKLVGLIQPEQIHIAFGKSAQDIVIMWATLKDGKFYVEIAESADKMKKLEAERAVLEWSSEKAAKYLHRVYVPNLKAGEKYVYRIVGDSGANSNIFTFKVPQDKPGKVHIFLFTADVGLFSDSTKFLAYEAANGMYETVFHVGDIAYNLKENQGSVGDNFLKHMEKFAAKVPYMTVPGDHERFHNFYHYRHRFSMPNSPWPMPYDQLWYTMDIGPVHFISLNTEVFYTLTDQQDKQLTWLRNDLDKVNAQRDKYPWVIVLGHRPMYCSPSRSNEPHPDCLADGSSAIRAKLEDLFFEQGVDLYISGHQHNYERSWPVYRGNVFQNGYRNPKAPVYIVNGAMGYGILAETLTKVDSWSAFSTSDPSREMYGKLEVLNSTHLLWDAYVAKNNEHVDSALIVQQRHGPFGKAGDEAYQTLVKLQQLPRAPFDWKPPDKAPSQGPVMHALYLLPPPTRKVYLMTVCLTLLFIIICLVCTPRIRRRIWRK